MPSVLGRDRRQFQRGNDLSVLLSNDSTEKGYQKDARILRVRGREMKLGD